MNDALLYWGLILIAGALLLAVVEVFLPSGGIIGLVAGILAIVGVVVLFRFDTTWGLTGLLGLIVLVPATVAFAFKVWPHTPMGRKFILGSETEEERAERLVLERQERDQIYAILDARGTSITPLHPVGVVLIDGTRYDALAEGTWIEANRTVRVTKVDGLQIKVREV
ncbi:MAG: hypothetical protein KDA28_11675 [Phycisphaerales bacterium]|nr:hypothetical protein [Phycisphaerales bacterium]